MRRYIAGLSSMILGGAEVLTGLLVGGLVVALTAADPKTDWWLSIALGVTAGLMVMILALDSTRASALGHRLCSWQTRVAAWGGIKECDCESCTPAQPPF